MQFATAASNTTITIMKKLSKKEMKTLTGGSIALRPRCTTSADCQNACSADIFSGYECVRGACMLFVC